MTRGFLMHAYNNLEVDYGTMALCSALLIKKHLKTNSVALATSRDTIDYMTSVHGEDLVNSAFDHIMVNEPERNVANRTFHDTRYSSKVQPYYNADRVTSFDLTPFDETILIDVDYLVLDGMFDSLWGSMEDLMVNKAVSDLSHTIDLNGFDSRFNEMSIPLYWATVVYFKKNERMRGLFNLMKFIKENYHFYQNLYQFSPSGYFRNDYALSIAIHMMHGQVENDSVVNLPQPCMLVATENDDLVGFNNGKAVFVSESQQGKWRLHRVETNVHVMNKWSIGRMATRIIEYARN